MVTANWPELDLRACEEAQMNELFKFAEQMVSNVNYRFEKTVVTTRGGGGGGGGAGGWKDHIKNTKMAIKVSGPWRQRVCIASENPLWGSGNKVKYVCI